MLRTGFVFAAMLTLIAGCASVPAVCVPAAVAAPAVTAPPAPAAAQPPAATSVLVPSLAAADAALNEAIVGSWIVPRDSSDFSRMPARGVYRADGTYTLYYFDTPACDKVKGQVDADWHIERGLLIEKVTRVSTSQFGKVGDLSTDQIITMDGKTMTLRSLRAGPFGWSLGNPMFSRQKSEGCYDAGAHG